MKNSIIGALLVLSSLSAGAQKKIVSGKIFYRNVREMETGKQIDTLEANFYQVYLLKQKRPHQKGLTVDGGFKSVFKFSLTEEDIKEYKYIEFVAGGKKSRDYYKIMPISDFMEKDSCEIIADKLVPVSQEDAVEMSVYKPAIYLYPEQTTKVIIKHEFKGIVLNTFPPYEKGWEVLAEPNGKLKNLADGRNYAYLFWDGNTSFSKEHYHYKDGFYVSRKDNIQFLQEHLSLLGLNETEINDFIVYWLPQLNKNETNFIHFWVNDNIDHSSKLDVQPQPETMIRVFMEFAPYDGNKPMLPKQVLHPTPRKGFVLVEWGGGPVGSNKIE